jgi:hypothetical protein
MIGVIFHAETPEQSMFGDVLAWRNILSKFKVDFYIVVDEGKIIPDWKDKVIPSHRVSSLEEGVAILKSKYPTCKPIYFDKTGSPFTTQPGDVCFIFGSDHSGLKFSEGIKNKLIDFDLWAINCASIALWEQSK